jgi:hypothetical protein
VTRTAPSGQIDTINPCHMMKAMSNKTKPPKVLHAKSITVASQGMCNSVGLWRLFEHARKTEPHEWCMKFLDAFFNGRANVKQREAMIRGEYNSTHNDDQSITISVTTE